MNDVEVELVYMLVEMQTKHDRKVGASPSLYGGASDRGLDENSAEALAAEVAYCKLVNAYPPTNTEGGENWDCLTWRGDRIDVKWKPGSFLENGPLLQVKAKGWRGTKPDAFALMCGDIPTFHFIGYMLSVDLMVDEYYREPKDGRAPDVWFPCWVADADRLRDWLWLSETWRQ